MTSFKKTVMSVAVTSSILLAISCTSDEGQSYRIGKQNQVDRPLQIREEVGKLTTAESSTIISADSGNTPLAPQANIRLPPSVDQSHQLLDSAAMTIAPRPLLEQQIITQSEQYATLTDNPVVQTHLQPVSTFSIDVDTGSYSNIRRFLQNGQLPPIDAVRVEEMLNYFSYEYPDTASSEQPFSVTTELGATPWNNKTQLLHVGLKGYTPAKADDIPANLVFLIDVSGSMNSPDKLGLLKSSISMLAQELDSRDTVSIVVYAGSSGTVLPPTTGNNHHSINRALAKLTAGGSTNGAQGIELAYQLAGENFTDGGVNRVILATDGDFNVGLSDVNELKKLIEKKRESGIALTTLGFGKGNYNDHLMEQLADVGNGAYSYIDTLGEARKVLVDELQATLLTIAKDVKIQVEFNPAVISEYRLIGYTNRKLANEDFNNDRVDAGEIGAGHTVTALYEVALAGSGGELHSPLRYGNNEPVNTQQPLNNEVAEVRLRYNCLLYTSPSPRDRTRSRMPSSA